MTGNKTSKWIVGLACTVSFLALSPKAAAAEQKIGYLDMQKAIQETSTGKKAKKDLEKEFNAKKVELQKKEADLKKMSEDLEKKSAALSDEARTKKQQELQGEMVKFQREVQESQVKIQKKEHDLTAPILEKIQGAVEKVAKAGGYTMVLEKNEQSVLWATKDSDLTDNVVKEFEKNTK